jgi:hypothetical protein
MQFVGSFFSLAFLFLKKKKQKNFLFSLIQDESASGAIFTTLTAIFFDPIAHPQCALSKLRLAASFKSFVRIKLWP